MRAVQLSDLDLAARAVMAAPRSEWDRVATELITQAHVADKWRKRTGRARANGASGSLYAQAALCPVVPAPGCGPSYCAALAHVLRALDRWRARSVS